MLLMTTAGVLAGLGGGGRESSQMEKRTLNSYSRGAPRAVGLPRTHVSRLHVHKTK